MTITGGSGLSKEEIDRMMADAEAHAAEDRQRREQAELRNSADTLVHQTEKFLADNAEQVTEDARSNVEGPLADLRTALERDDAPAIRSAMEKVSAASQALGAAIYAQRQPGDESTGSGAGGGAGRSDDDIVDAEIVEEGDQR